MKRKPLDLHVTPWRRFGTMALPEGVQAETHRRAVRDGRLTVIVAQEPQGWHLSISFKPDVRDRLRYPTWDEIAEARYRFCPDGITMAMLLPPMETYVAVHDTTFHLHEVSWPGDVVR